MLLMSGKSRNLYICCDEFSQAFVIFGDSDELFYRTLSFSFLLMDWHGDG